MNPISGNEIFHDLVLVGGGHANIQVIRAFAMRPIKHLRVTLISNVGEAPYSGMLPGVLAGWYSKDDAHFDLRNICQRAGVRFLKDEVRGVDVKSKTLKLRVRKNLSYDTLSINVGCTPNLKICNRDDEIPFNILPLKPISQFLDKWQTFKSATATHLKDREICVIVVGGGASAVEISLIIRKILCENKKVRIDLFQKNDRLLDGHNRRVSKIFANLLRERTIQIHLGEPVINITQGRAKTSKREYLFDFAFIATEATAPTWFAESNLPTDEKGFLKVDKHLNIVGYADLFAAGDCANFCGTPLPKSGVFAVRQGSTLAKNIFAPSLSISRFLKYRPQKQTLSLLTTGEKSAVLSYGPFTANGSIFWFLKDRIDRKFMKKFKLERMKETNIFHDEIRRDFKKNTCGGCGGKVGFDVFRDLIHHDRLARDDFVIKGLAELGDCAVIKPKEGGFRLDSVDFFKAFTDDPYSLGFVGMLHALSDVYAMGGMAQTAMLIVGIPSAPAIIQRREFGMLYQGILDAASQEGVVISGGHTLEMESLSLGVAVCGWLEELSLFDRQGLKGGQKIILTKKIGVGALMAANMLGKARGDCIDAAIDSMFLSNKLALPVLIQFGVRTCTDVTGFGLGGHLMQMLRKQSARIDINRIPLLDGFRECLAAGILSGISESNGEMIQSYSGKSLSQNQIHILSDPQTNGGLLCCVDGARSEDCLDGLRKQGFESAAIIGEVLDGEGLKEFHD